MYRFAAVPTGPWLSAVYHVHACKRYYGLMRRSDELRPAWAYSAYSGRSLPWRAVRLTFPSLLWHTVHACCDTSTPLADQVLLMAHHSVMRAFTVLIRVRLLQDNPPRGLHRRKQFRGGSLLVMLRPACWLARLARPRQCFRHRQARPFYGRACPSQGLPSPGSAITTRPNHPLPRQDHPRSTMTSPWRTGICFFAAAPDIDASRVTIGCIGCIGYF
jgi:hypothetical protein